MKQSFSFPDEFLWGSSTSAYQCEGAFDEDGKGLTVQDTKEIIANTSDFKVSSDHYHRFKEDIELLAQMGSKAYRFSISWARIFPNGKGKINQKGVQHYHQVIDTCLAYNIKPIVTLYHFDLPNTLEENGGWQNPETINAFTKYCEVCFKEYGDKVPYFLTINEQNVMIIKGSVIGTRKKQLTTKEMFQENHYMMVAQSKAFALCHKIAPKAKIGPAPNIASIYPLTSKPEDYTAKLYGEAYRNWLYLDIACKGEYNTLVWNYLKRKNATPDITEEEMRILKEGKPDFIAFNYYCTITMAKSDLEGSLSDNDQQIGYNVKGLFKAIPNPALERTPFGWTIDSEGFTTTLIEIYDRYHLPLIVTENGIGMYDKVEDDGSIHDDGRIEYYKSHIKAMAKALECGVDLFGYCPWSSIDLISTHEGFKKRYGFIYIDRTDDDIKSLNRFKKDSFYWYKSIIESNGKF